MDQVKIGKFIAERRKLVGLTQMQLAERLGITDRAVSKWERGISMPDSSIMLALCDILNVNVNDLLCGEVVTMEQYNKELENHLMEMIRQKERADKRLLSMEILAGVMSLLPFFAALAVWVFVPMEEWLAAVIIGASLLPFVIATPFLLRIEQVAGYYECGACGHRYVPSYKSVFLAGHVGRTRRLRCPKCHQKTWHKKVINPQ